jgi:hypothetical protein
VSKISARLFALGSLLSVMAGCHSGGCGWGPAALSAQQEGHFKAVAFDKTCEKRSAVRDLSMDFAGERPIFATQTEEDGLCRWAIATVIDGRAIPLVSVGQDLSDRLKRTSLASGADQTYWAIVDDRYVNFGPSGDAIFYSPVNAGSIPISLRSTTTGRTFAVEMHDLGNFNERYDLVDVRNRKSLRLSSYSVGPSLERDLDGDVYLNVGTRRPLHRWKCSKYKVNESRRGRDERFDLREIGNCGTLGRDGAIWSSMRLGVQEHYRGQKKFFYPVEPDPACSSFMYRVELIAADQIGNVWFVYQKLWHIDPTGRLFSTNLPVKSTSPSDIGATVEQGQGIGYGQLVAAKDGTVWLSDGWSLYHFLREP